MERITLRIPSELHQELKQKAEKNNRSLNAQILTYLQQCVNDTVKTSHTARAESQSSKSPRSIPGEA